MIDVPNPGVPIGVCAFEKIAQEFLYRTESL